MIGISIVGLGPGDPELLTRRAWRVLETAGEVFLRTARHPGVEALPSATYHNFDDWYDHAEDFDALYRRIATEIVSLGARPQGVVFAVPGHPLVGETTVFMILDLAKERGIPVSIVDGLSFIEPTLNALKLDCLNGLQIQDAVDVARLHHPQINPDIPAILGQVYSNAVASDVKLTLANQFPDEHLVLLIHGAGTAHEELESLPLYKMDRSQKIGHLTSLYVPPLPQAGSFERFQEIMAHLRAPEGCPWDRKQTHLSLRKYLIEETYEVLDALDAEDMDALREELGDLMLQIVFHTQIAIESGDFRMPDVLGYIIAKMIARHPHVWGDLKVSGEGEVLTNWETLKKQEREAKGEAGQAKSMLDGVPRSLPALIQAHSYQERAARVGFDWSEIQGVLDILREEIAELETAEADEQRFKELGDVLFSVVNLARWYKIDPEAALRETNRKFARRFHYIEQKAGRDLKELSMQDMEALWQAAKVEERTNGNST